MMNSKLVFAGLGLIFFLSIFLFAVEIPFFQYILASTTFVLLFTGLGIIVTYFALKKAMVRQGWKDIFMMFGFLSIFNVFFLVSIASKYNRHNISGKGTKVIVKDIKYEFNTMFGILETDRQKAQATHMRLQFDYNNRSYNRAFKIENVFLGQEQSSEIYLIIDEGNLGFDFIRY